jgi:hypothetical protein
VNTLKKLWRALGWIGEAVYLAAGPFVFFYAGKSLDNASGLLSGDDRLILNIGLGYGCLLWLLAVSDGISAAIRVIRQWFRPRP